MSKDPGHILIQYNNYNIETTLFFAIFSLTLFFVLIYILSNLSSFIVNFLSTIGSILTPYSKHKSTIHNLAGINNSIANNWENAEYYFSKAVKRRPELTTLLCAAYTASKSSIEKAEPYLETAYIKHSKDAALITLFHARLHINAENYKTAIKKIYDLPQKERVAATALYLLSCCYEKLEMWEELADTLKKCYKYNALSKNRTKILENKYFAYKLESSDPTKAYKTWKTLPKHSRETPYLIKTYAKKLLKNKDEKSAIQIIEKNIAKNFDASLISMYQSINTMNDHNILKQLLKWLELQPQNNELQIAVGRIYKRQGDKLKALVYMEKATANTSDISALIDIAGLYHELDRDTQIKDIYKRIVKIIKNDEK